MTLFSFSEHVQGFFLIIFHLTFVLWQIFTFSSAKYDDDMRECLRCPSQLSNKKRYDFFKQVWEEKTARIDFCEYFCAIHKRLSLFKAKSSLFPLSCLTCRRNWRRSISTPASKQERDSFHLEISFLFNLFNFILFYLIFYLIYPVGLKKTNIYIYAFAGFFGLDHTPQLSNIPLILNLQKHRINFFSQIFMNKNNLQHFCFHLWCLPN